MKSTTALFGALLVIGALASPALAVQTHHSITGLMVKSDSNCPSPVPAFDQDDCSYNASNPTGSFVAEWIGPLFNAGYYAPGTSPGPAIAGANDPVPGDGKTPPAISGTVDIDDQDTADGTDDTINASIVVGQTVRNFGAGARGTAEETWTTLTISFFGPVTVSSATANANGGFDYVIGSLGMPPRLVDAATGTDIWPSETGADADSAVGVGHYWAAPSPIGIAPIEANASIGTTARLTTTGYSCVDTQDGIGGAASACDAKGRMGDGITGGGLDFENIILSLSTDSTGDIVSASMIWVQQQDVIFPAGPDSWVAGVIDFSGACTNCVAGEAQDDTYSVDENSASNVLNIGANDTNFGNPTSATISVTPNHGGTATIQNSPGDPAAITVNYTPAAGFSGTETFQYTMDDGRTVTDSATVTVLVLRPDANDDAATTRLNALISIPVGANDQGFGDPSTATISIAPDAGGTAVIRNSPGAPAGIAVDFTPAAPLGTSTYTETFQYTISDGLATGSATVTVTVNNRVPVAPDYGTSTGESTPVTVDIAGLPGADLGDALSSITISALPAHGDATVAGHTVTYTPIGVFGTDAFQYTITDADGEAATGTISVSLTLLVPVANDDIANVIEGDTVNIDVTANDFLGSGSQASHTVQITRRPNVGSATVVAGNQVSYASVAGSHGNDNFEYTLTDADGDVSAPATVQVGIGVARVPTPAGGVSSVDLWTLLLLGGLLVRRATIRRRAYAPD